MDEATRAAGRKARIKNIQARQALARKFGLPYTDFMPKQILGTLAKYPRISRSAVPAALLKTASAGPRKANGAGNGADIPLSAIPDKRPGTHRTFPEETKRAAVAMIGKKSFAEVAQEFNVSGGVLNNWAKVFDPLARLRIEVEQERSRRKSRLEQAAMIMELEGAREIAIRIRSFARTLDGTAKRK